MSDKVQLTLFRPQDFLHLNLTFTNFFVFGNTLQQTSGAEAFLIVQFEPQSLAEKAFVESLNTADKVDKELNDFKTSEESKFGSIAAPSSMPPSSQPIQTSLSQKSRLVFRIPTQVQNIALTAEKK